MTWVSDYLCIMHLADYSVSCGNNYNRVRMAICSGFFRNAAKKGQSSVPVELIADVK